MVRPRVGNGRNDKTRNSLHMLDTRQPTKSAVLDSKAAIFRFSVIWRPKIHLM